MTALVCAKVVEVPCALFFCCWVYQSPFIIALLVSGKQLG